MTRKKETYLKKITAEVKHEHEEVIKGASMMLNHAIAVGIGLWKIKKTLKHGEYRPWVEKHLNFGITNEWRYRKIAKNEKHLKPYIQDGTISTIDQACKWLSKENNEKPKKRDDVNKDDPPSKDLPLTGRNRKKFLSAYLADSVRQVIESWPEPLIEFYALRDNKWDKIVKRMGFMAKEWRKEEPTGASLNSLIQERKARRSEKAKNKDAA